MQNSFRKFIIAGALILAILGSYVTFMQTNQSVASASDALADAQQTYSADAAAVRQYSILRVQRDRAASELAQIPVGNLTQPAFVEYLSALARHHHVRIASLTFISATPPPAAAAPAANTGGPGAPDPALLADPKPSVRPTDQPTSLPLAPAADSKTFLEHGMKITMSGKYRDVLFAIADLSRGQALVRVDGPPTTTASDSPDHEVNAEFPATLLEVNSDVIKLMPVVLPAPLNGPNVFHGVPIETRSRSRVRAGVQHAEPSRNSTTGSSRALLPAVVVPVQPKATPAGLVVHMTPSPLPRTPLLRRAQHSKRKVPSV